MNRFLGPASLAVSLLALAVASWGPRESEAPPAPPPPAAPAASSSRELRDMEVRVKLLEDNALSLSRRLMLIEQGRAVPAADGGVAVAVPPSLAADVEQLRAEVRGLTTTEGGRDYLKGVMRSVQEEMRTEQRDLRQDRMMQSQAQLQQRQAERVRQFVTEARLSSSQERDLVRSLESESTRRQEILEASRSGANEGRNPRQEIRQLREQTDTQVKAALDESQRAQYDEMRREEWRGGGRGQGQGQGQGGWRAGPGDER